MSDIHDQGPQNAAQAEAHSAFLARFEYTWKRVWNRDPLKSQFEAFVRAEVDAAVKVAREDAEANAKRAEAAEAEVARLKGLFEWKAFQAGTALAAPAPATVGVVPNETFRDIWQHDETARVSLRKIRDLPEQQRPCFHPEHNPPGMIVLEPGIYEHTCPGCGKRVEFIVGHGPSLGFGLGVDGTQGGGA